MEYALIGGIGRKLQMPAPFILLARLRCLLVELHLGEQGLGCHDIKASVALHCQQTLLHLLNHHITQSIVDHIHHSMLVQVSPACPPSTFLYF